MKKLTHFMKLVWKVAPGYVVMLVVNALTVNARLFCNIIFPRFLIEELMGQNRIGGLLLWGGMIVGSNIGFTFLANTLKRYLDVKSRVVYHRMNQIMAEKIMKLEYSCLETPYYLDLKDKAVFAVNNLGATVNLIQTASEMMTGLLTLAGLFAIMAMLGPVLLLALLVALALMLLIYRSMSKYQVKITQEMIPINRRFGYFFGLGLGKEVQKDCRLYDMSDILLDRMVKYTDETCTMFDQMGEKSGAALGGMNVLNDIVAAFCYLYVGLRTLGERVGSLYLGPKISIGSLTMYVTAAITFSVSMRKVGESVVYAMQLLSFMEPYMEFMSLKEETAKTGRIPFTGEFETIDFEDVSFTYPGAEKQVLTHVSFSIRKGEKISIVGLNGAGKSTLVKLLCRMYKVDSGRILINGRNLYDYDYESYMGAIAAVFQDYRLFNYTIGENISCQEKDADREKVSRLLREVGLEEKIASLKEGIDARLGKEYDKDGVELSGGEGQKVAIARALYKKGSLVILDEPASALDPVAEAEIYEKFNSLVQEKTAVYISHRMSSSIFCDRILILDGGTVADFDTHENLMKKTDSLYYRLFRSQAENYQV